MTKLILSRQRLSDLAAGICTVTVALCLAIGQASAVGENLALGKTVTFDKPPSYPLCTDPNDDKQLTDGVYSDEGEQREVNGSKLMWAQPGAVGWTNVKPVIITIDLGEKQPIAGISYSTAGGGSSVAWPNGIYVAVSSDNTNWQFVGDLVALSRQQGRQPGAGYQSFRYIANGLQTYGRYVRFGIVDVPYTFCDEIEVYRGDAANLDKPVQGIAIIDMKSFAAEMVVTSAAQKRLQDDLDLTRQKLNSLALPANQKDALNTRLDTNARAIATLEKLPIEFRTSIPLNPTHRDTLAVWGELLKAQGHAPLTVWKQHRYQWLPLLATPDKSSSHQLNIELLKNQFRSDSILFTNATGSASKMMLKLQNPPRGAQPGWLQVDSVDWTDTSQGTPVADARLPLTAQNGVFTVDVPAGITRKVWVMVDSAKLPAGDYQSSFAVEGGKQNINVPLHIKVAPLTMKTPRYSLGMWDYANGKGAYGVTARNRTAAIKAMLSHYVNAAWANRAVLLPFVEAGDFDAQNNLKKEPDFTALDNWIREWKGVRRFFVYARVEDNIAGSTMGTPAFDAKVGSWAKALSKHIKQLGLRPQQFSILLVDEPHRDVQAAIVANWAKAIKAVAPELTLFEDPNMDRPDQLKHPESITAVDILCVPLPSYYRGGEPVAKFWKDMRAQGKEFWFYQASGPTRLFDPQAYFRYHMWHSFKHDAVGGGFWSFGDTGGAPTSWNEYNSGYLSYAPAFIDTEKIYDSIHWEAVREGVEDYEELSMLRDAIAHSKNTELQTQGQAVLDRALETVTKPWTPRYNWETELDISLGDSQLEQVRTMLLKLSR